MWSVHVTASRKHCVSFPSGDEEQVQEHKGTGATHVVFLFHTFP